MQKIRIKEKPPNLKAQFLYTDLQTRNNNNKTNNIDLN